MLGLLVKSCDFTSVGHRQQSQGQDSDDTTEVHRRLRFNWNRKELKTERSDLIVEDYQASDNF